LQNNRKVGRMKSDKWFSPYIGLCVNERFDSLFQNGVREMPWVRHGRFESTNCYDEAENVHNLYVDICHEGPFRGFIENVRTCHHHYFKTTSNAQDHAESYDFEVRSPNQREIVEYCSLLNSISNIQEDPKEIKYDDDVYERLKWLGFKVFQAVVSKEHEFHITRNEYEHAKYNYVLEGPRCRIYASSVVPWLFPLYKDPSLFFSDCSARSWGLSLHGRYENEDDIRWLVHHLDVASYYQYLGVEPECRKVQLENELLGTFNSINELVGLNSAEINKRVQRFSCELFLDPVRNYSLLRREAYEELTTGLSVGGPSFEMPIGSICFFDERRKCVGYVDESGRCFLAPRFDNAVGWIDDNGSVYNSANERVAEQFGQDRWWHTCDRSSKGRSYRFGKECSVFIGKSVNGAAYTGYCRKCVGDPIDQSKRVCVSCDGDVRLGAVALFYR